MIVLIRINSLYDLWVIFVVSEYFYKAMNCFGLVCVTSSLLRVGSVAADSFEWVVANRFRWFRVALGGFRWFAVLVVTVNTIKILKILPKFFNRFLNIARFLIFFKKINNRWEGRQLFGTRKYSVLKIHIAIFCVLCFT